MSNNHEQDRSFTRLRLECLESRRVLAANLEVAAVELVTVRQLEETGSIHLVLPPPGPDFSGPVLQVGDVTVTPFREVVMLGAPSDTELSHISTMSVTESINDFVHAEWPQDQTIYDYLNLRSTESANATVANIRGVPADGVLKFDANIGELRHSTSSGLSDLSSSRQLVPPLAGITLNEISIDDVLAAAQSAQSNTVAIQLNTTLEATRNSPDRVVMPSTIDIGPNAIVMESTSVADFGAASDDTNPSFGDTYTKGSGTFLWPSSSNEDGSIYQDDVDPSLTDPQVGSLTPQTAPRDNGDSGDLNNDDSDLTPDFGVEPNRDVLPDDDVSDKTTDDVAKEAEAVTIDIAKNSRRRSICSLNTLNVADGDYVAQQEKAAHRSIAFRVEPTMARVHQIALRKPVRSHPGFSANNAEVSSATAKQQERYEEATANQLVAALINPTLLAAETVPQRQEEPAAWQPESNEPLTVVSHDKVPGVLPEETRSRWQTLVDILIASAGGAMVYSGRVPDEREAKNAWRRLL